MDCPKFWSSLSGLVALGVSTIPVGFINLSINRQRLRTTCDQLLCSFYRFVGGFDYFVGAEAKSLLQLLQGSGGSEGVHADDDACHAHILRPAEGRGLLDSDTRLHARRQNLFFIGLVLMLEEVP